MSDTKPSHHCSFCGKSNFEVAQMIAGDCACICDECIEICVVTLFSEARKKPNPTTTEEPCNNQPASPTN